MTDVLSEQYPNRELLSVNRTRFVTVDCDTSQKAVKDLISYIGEDPTRDGLIDTPKRVVDSLMEMTSGYTIDPYSILKTFEDGAALYDEMVFEGAIPFTSLCEHHMLPFMGYAYIAYIPDGKIVGLSKLARLLDAFSKRLQVQERLTTQIVETLMDGIKPKGAAVVLKARHLCMEIRGVQKQGVETITSALRGSFKEFPEVREEFYSLIAMTVR